LPSDPAPLWKYGASDLAEAIRTGRTTSEEVVQAHLDRIEAVNSSLNAVSVVLRDEALAAARRADRAIETGKPVGPLHGVPITVKENIDLAGSATSHGMRGLSEARPTEDAPFVAQLRRAGVIPIGRTNLPDLGLRWHTDNELRGATRNPWDGARTPGGSSGGEAAALATGMTPLGLGNDYGGSVRWPSQCCGTVALKPTTGRIPRHLSLAPQEGAITAQLYAVDGPMARHVRDLRLALAHMSGPDPRDPWWAPAPLEGPPIEPPLRVALLKDPDGLGVHPDVAEGVGRAADALSNAGYAVEEAAPPSAETGARLWAESVMPEIRLALHGVMKTLGGRDALRFLEAFLEVVPDAGVGGYMSALANRNAHAREWAQFLARYPLVLGPVCTDPAFLVGRDLEGTPAVEDLLRAMRLVVTVNLLGLPSVAVPTGATGGLPQGVQLIGARFREDLCLDAAEAIEDALGVMTPIDPAS
jgi:amidase